MDLNFITNNINEGDKDLFFGPIESTDIFIELKDNWSMAHIMKESNIFSSISQARKNGWDREIPEGFSKHMVGKKANRKNIFILNKRV